MPDPAARDVIQAMSEKIMASLSDQYNAGTISLADWYAAMQDEIRRMNALQLIAGGHGTTIDITDWRALETRLEEQYKYLADFRRAIVAKEVDPAAVSSRAVMYARSARTTFSEQATKTVALPTQPGQQQCLGNCLCEWVNNGDGSWTWDRTNEKGTSCPDCIRNAQIYNPYWPAGAQAAA